MIRSKRIYILFICLIVCSGACSFINTVKDVVIPPTSLPYDQAYTQVAELVIAGMTLTAVANSPLSSSTPMPLPIVPVLETPPSIPVEEGVVPQLASSTPPLVAKLPTATPTSLAAATAAACTYEAFLDSETIPPGKEMPLNHKFTKVWRIRNSGTCTWANGFELMCSKGCDLFGVRGSIPIARPNIQPKMQVEISIEMRSPKEIGKYTAIWMIRGDGKIFGVQPDGKGALYVSVKTTD